MISNFYLERDEPRPGCMINAACNRDFKATVPQESCTYPIRVRSSKDPPASLPPAPPPPPLHPSPPPPLLPCQHPQGVEQPVFQSHRAARSHSNSGTLSRPGSTQSSCNGTKEMMQPLSNLPTSRLFDCVGARRRAAATATRCKRTRRPGSAQARTRSSGCSQSVYTRTWTRLAWQWLPYNDISRSPCGPI